MSFNDDCHQQEERDDSGFAEIRRSECGKNRQRHQFIHVDASFTKVFDRRQDDWKCQNDRADESAELCGECLSGQEPEKKIGVQDQETADDSESDSAHGPAMPHAFSDRRTAGDAARRFFRRSFVMMPASACGSMFMRVIMCASGTVFVCCFTHYF